MKRVMITIGLVFLVTAEWLLTPRQMANATESNLLLETNWSPFGTLTEMTSTEQYTEVASDALGNLYTIWVDSDSVFCRRRIVSGKWSSDEKVDDNTGEETRYPHITVDDSENVYAVWLEDRDPQSGGDDFRLMFNEKPAGGSWGTPQNLSGSGGHLHRDISPDIAVNSRGDIYVTWATAADVIGGDGAIYSRFRYKGQGWYITEVVNPAVADRHIMGGLSVAIDSARNGYAMWSAYDNSLLRRVYFTTHPVGSVWQATEFVGAYGSAEQTAPDLAVTPSGNLHAVWIDLRSKGDVYYSSRQVGSTWSPEYPIDTQGSGSCLQPQIATDSLGNVVAMWVYDYYSGYIYSGYKPSGGTWSSSTLVNQGSSLGGLSPSIALDSIGNAYTTWVRRYYRTVMFAMTQPVFHKSGKSADSLLVAPGETSTYQISIYNTLPFSTTFDVTDELPEHTTYVTGTLAVSQGLTSTNEGMITWTGDISTNQTLTATFEVEVSPTVTQTKPSVAIVNQASVSTSTQNGDTVVKSITFVNPYQVYLPLVQRN